MKQVYFSDGQKPLTTDMNAIHENTELAIFTLMKALVGSDGKVLFDSISPVVSYGPSPNLNITVSPQYFAVDGAIGLAPEITTILDATGDLKVGVFLAIRKDPVEEIRNFISLDDPSNILIQEDLETTIAKDDLARVQFTTTSDLLAEPPDPALSSTDLGFVRLATVTFDASPKSPVTSMNSTDVVTFPSSATVPTTSHAATHLPGGADEVSVSIINPTSSGGSSVGWMPLGAYTATLGAVQSVEAADTAGYLTVVTTGDNTVSSNDITAKTVEISLALASSLTTVDVSGASQLSVAYSAKNATNGVSDLAARKDHTHPTSASGVLVETFSLEVTSSSALLGTVVGPYTVTGLTSTTVGKLFSIQVYWQPPNLPTNDTEFGVESEWFLISNLGQVESVGCRAIVNSKDTFSLELGEAGLVYLSQTTIDAINAVITPNWTGGNLAQVGTLKINVIALREGSFDNTVTVI